MTNHKPEEYPLQFKFHAGQRMLKRSIHPQQIESVLRHGKLLRRYPNDSPRESYLMSGKVLKASAFEKADDQEGLPPEDTDESLLRPIHVVAADVGELGITVVITVYEPDDDKWEDEHRWKKSWSTTQNTWRE